MMLKRSISVFDVIGPIMVGPSSSHTAGAVRLGRVGRSLLNCIPQQALIELHGSFAETGLGHGTDKAIIAGLLGLTPQDTRLRESLLLAKAEGMQFEFRNIDLGDEAHPNSCRITISKENERVTYTGCSLGGGLIEINYIQDFPVSLNGNLDCLLVISNDQPGTINKITGWLLDNKINVAFFSVNRQQRGGKAFMTIQIDQQVPPKLVDELYQLPWVHWVRAVNKIED